MPKITRGHSLSGWVNKLWFCVEQNDQKTLKGLLANGADVNHVFKEQGCRSYSQTAISIAVMKNNLDLVKLLISYNCNLEHADAKGETPLFYAVRIGKLTMIRYLIQAGCNANHCNAKGENILIQAIRLGRKDIVQYLLDIGVNASKVNKEHNNALFVALELYENFNGFGYALRRRAPSNLNEVITLLIPKCSSLNYIHPNKGSILRIALNIEAANSPLNLKLTKMLLQHGAVPDRLFFLRYGGLVATNTVPGAEFFTEKFFNMAIIAGANLQRERAWLFTVISEMPEELSPHLQLFLDLLVKCSNPLSLQSLCVMVTRKSLQGAVPLWKNIDALPLPSLLKDALKLVD